MALFCLFGYAGSRMSHFLVFGSHPLLSLAEAKAVIDGEKPIVLGEALAVVDGDTTDTGWKHRLAGTVKCGDIIYAGTKQDFSIKTLAEFISAHPRGTGKVHFGLTVYATHTKDKEKHKKLPIELKRALTEQGRSVRWVTGDRGDLTPAAVAKLELMTQGYDFVVGIDETHVFVGVTTHVQDADAWSLRDYGRPARDAKNGMLPPKLARMMVNLAMDPTVKPDDDRVLLDPFCGGGTVLMEAALLGVTRLIGSDISPKQIEDTKRNLDWLVSNKILPTLPAHELFVSSAEQLDKHLKPHSLDAVVTEGYLGEPLRGDEPLSFLEKQKREVERIWTNTLQTLAPLIKSGGTIVCATPVFKTRAGTVAVDIKPAAERAGYIVVDPLAGWKDKPVTLTYAREDQHVKRNIVVLKKSYTSG